MASGRIRSIIAVLLVGVSVARGELKVGDEAPELKVGAWAQGEEVAGFRGDKVYIVEFWATWCGPCIASIPHLDEIHRKHSEEGLIVIGQNLGEDASKVNPFVKNMAGKMSYRVAIDDKAEGGWMAKHWLTAAGQNGIPCAFVVSKKGKIAYIGHPMELKESLLESLLAEPSTLSEKGADPAPKATGPGEKASALITRAQTEIRAGKLDAAEQAIGELQEVLPKDFGYIGGLLEIDVLLARKQPADALELSKLLAEDYRGKPSAMLAVATHLTTPADASPALLDAATKIASPLSAAAGDTQAAALSAMARISWLRGDKAAALELQQKAIPLYPKELEAAAKSALEAYRQDQLPAVEPQF